MVCIHHFTCYLHIVYSISTYCLQHMYNISTTYLQHTYNISTTHLQHIYNISTTYLQHIYNISTAYLQHIYKTYLPSTHLQLCSFEIVFICNWSAHSPTHSPCALTFMAAHSPKKCVPAETTHFQRKRTQTRVCAYRCAARSLVKTDTSS